MKEPRLFTPGPTPVPEEVRRASALPMIHHRSKEFAEILHSVRAQLKTLCDTSGEVVILTSSGSGGMEATVQSLFFPGDQVLIVSGGRFGERWVELAKRFELDPIVLSVEWGKAVKPEDVAARITPKVKGILIQACESSTGAYHPIHQIGSLLRNRDDILFVVDGITAVGVHDVSMNRDRIDALVCATQKALMSPPGLATVALGPKALERVQQNAPRGYYFSLAKEVQAQSKGNTGFTPAVSLFRALDTALQMITKEGKPALFERHRAMQQRARMFLKQLDISLVNSDQDASWGITAGWTPSGREVKDWLRLLKEQHGLWLAGGQGQFEGKIFRLSHMGYCYPNDLEWALETIKKSLS